MLCSLLTIFAINRVQAQLKLVGIPGTTGGFSNVVIDKDDNIYFDDNSRVRKKNAITGVVTTIAGTGINGHTGDGGAATLAKIDVSMKIAVAPNGDVYIAENFFNYLRKVDAITGHYNYCCRYRC